jgi:gluconolactonase
MTVFAKEFGLPEGPVLMPDGSFLFVEMTPDKGCITHVAADGKSRKVIAKTGRPNGLARDRHGNIWVAETNQHALLKMQIDGSYEVAARECNGEGFPFLNDVALGPNGDIFFTDSGILLDDVVVNGALVPNWRDLRYDGRVYRFDPQSRAVELIDRGIVFTNGLAFGPDQALYVNETMSGNIFRYATTNGRVTGKRELFGNVIEHFNLAELKGPDGMKFGADGYLYVCVYGQGDVTVLGKNGAVVERIKTEGGFPSNLVFGPAGSKKIYVTEGETGTVQIFDVGTDGLPLHV